MQITVSDEMIEKILREQIKNRIDNYLKGIDDPFYFSILFKKVAREEVCQNVSRQNIDTIYNNTAKEEILDKVAFMIKEEIMDAIKY